MNLSMKHKKYLVTGASSGLGKAVAIELLNQPAEVWLVARNQKNLLEISEAYPGQGHVVAGDVTDSGFLNMLTEKLPKDLYGVFINAGGPPAKTIEETSLDDWDDAYRLLLRWKVELAKRILPIFLKQQTGRFLFSESASINGPIANLVLSNSYRMAVVGFVKTLVKELPGTGITANIIAPGYHDTPALNRLFKKVAEQRGISEEEARETSRSKVPVGHFGKPDDFASLAAWLLSPAANFASGQIFTLDGGEGR